VIGLDVERRNEVPVARSRGDIDVANALQLREELAACLAPDGHVLVLDLTDTSYVDSAGLDMLFRLSELLRQRRARLLLVIAPDSQLARLAKIVALENAVRIHATVEDALEDGRTSVSPPADPDMGAGQDR
jgi:anti-sigma B factor antagonist